MWGYHDAATGAGRYDLYDKEMVKRYGEPNSLENFSDKMQLLNAIGYQGIFEATNHKLNETGGVMLWKLNAAFPSVIWQVYDWYLEPNSGYYFMQNACEPVHIQMNLDDSTVTVINRTHFATPALTASAQVFNMQGQKLFSETSKTMLATTGVKELIPLSKVLKGTSGVSFVILNLSDGSGKQVSHNAYWLAPDTNYTDLNKMKPAQLKAGFSNPVKVNGDMKYNVRVTNTSNQVAFFVRPQLMSNNEEVLPSYWSASYFTLAPHETMNINVSAPLNKLGANASLTVSAWNVPKQQVILKGK
jgi:hypothetical protein